MTRITFARAALSVKSVLSAKFSIPHSHPHSARHWHSAFSIHPHRDSRRHCHHLDLGALLMPGLKNARIGEMIHCMNNSSNSAPVDTVCRRQTAAVSRPTAVSSAALSYGDSWPMIMRNYVKDPKMTAYVADGYAALRPAARTDDSAMPKQQNLMTYALEILITELICFRGLGNTIRQLGRFDSVLAQGESNHQRLQSHPNGRFTSDLSGIPPVGTFSTRIFIQPNLHKGGNNILFLMATSSGGWSRIDAVNDGGRT